MAGDVVEQVRSHPRFRELVRKRGEMSRFLAVVMMIVYFGFIYLVAFQPELMARPVGGVFTLAFPLGLGVIVMAVIVTGLYVLRANGEFDKITSRIVEDVQ